ncbi:HAUS augmin-like complex subunit 6 [Haliotis rubra]|uniref:HAUS augmin-like complex subunit 6 n=1 Tax=Haliotis rubra TaxID=36100 RepID=UPI001EE5FCD9|nr:HAUS augmin-like complex subunit 6 [Haliotis rubra]
MEFDTSVLMRQAAPPSVDASGPLSKRQILFTNWLLLGLDVPTQQRTYSIPFNKDMFNLPNKAGAEAILHFLFDKLNPVMCKEEFRDCWRVTDKKTEAMFYRVCNKWLKNIQKEEPDSHLPRINASLFMSPGGERFYQLLFSFTSYVMQQVIKRDCDVKQRDKLTCPQLSSHNKHLSDVMYRMLQCGIVQRRGKFLEQVDRTISVSEEWRETASELVRENRRLSKSIRELEHQLREEIQRAHEKGLARGSPMPSKRKSFTSEHDRTPQNIRRAQRVQKARDKWKKLDAFCNFETRERHVIESILDRTVQKYHIDAADISVKVPDLLLRECENEILKRHVDNTYQGGRLNLLSLIQLWNLSLHLYIERFHQVGVPSLETESSHLTAAVHTHQAQTANANAFQKMLSDDFLPLLKQSVSRLREKLEADTSCLTDTPQSGRTKPVGLGLFSSTPPLSFTPKDEDPVPPQSALHITPQNEAVMTPEAADSIASTVIKSARNVAKTLFQGSPVYAPKMAMQGRLPFSDRIDTSKIPQPKQIKKDRPTSSRTPSKAREHLYQQSVQTPDTSLRGPHMSILTDPVSDVMSSSASTRSSTLTESQMGPGTPRNIAGIRELWNGAVESNDNTLTDSKIFPGTPHSVTGIRESWNGGMESNNNALKESKIGPGTPRSVNGGDVLIKTTPNKEPFLPVQQQREQMWMSLWMKLCLTCST